MALFGSVTDPSRERAREFERPPFGPSAPELVLPNGYHQHGWIRSISADPPVLGAVTDAQDLAVRIDSSVNRRVEEECSSAEATELHRSLS